MIEKIIIFLVLYLFFIPLFSQESSKHSFLYTNKPILIILKDIEKQYDVKFSYPSDFLEGKTVSIDEKNLSLDEILFEISSAIDIQFNRLDTRYIYLSEATTQKISEVILHSYLTTGISKKKDATYSISPKTLGLLAGQMETDILESIQQLPGVISINETATELNVRGGNSDQNQIIWDGINIYHGGHLYGMVSVFNPNIARKITFFNKGTNAKYGERISSVIDISTSESIPDKAYLNLGLNGISSDIFFESPLVNEKLSIQASYRRSYEDLFETETFTKYEKKAFQNTKIDEESFYFKDFNTKVNYKYNNNNYFHLSFIHIDNDLSNEFVDESNLSHLDVLDTENNGYSLHWDNNLKNHIALNTSLSHSHYSLFYNYKVLNDEKIVRNFRKTNTILDTKLSTTLNIKLANTNQLEFGYQNSIQNVSFLFKEEKDLVYILDADDSKINTHSLFSSLYFNNSRSINIYSGLRLNYYTFIEEFRLEPRIVITQTLNNSFKLQLTGEIKNQIISQIDETVLSDLSLEKKIWRLADNDKYPILNSHQISSNLLFSKNNWAADLDFYAKKTKGITALSLGFLNPIDNAFHLGEQKVFGVDFYLKRNFNFFKTWVSYSFIQAQNKYEGLNENKYFRANNDIKHALSVAANYNNKNFFITLGWKYRTGRPSTHLEIDTDGNAYFNKINTGQLTAYHRLDVSSTYQFILSKKKQIKGKIGLSIRNLYNRKNHLSTDYTGNNAIAESVRAINTYSIGFTPNFLFRLSW